MEITIRICGETFLMILKYLVPRETTKKIERQNSIKLIKVQMMAETISLKIKVTLNKTIIP